MRRRKRLFSTLVVLLFLLIDTSVIPFTGLNTLYVPKLALVAIITLALLMGRTQGILYGAIAGVLMDITVSIPTGLISILYTVCGFLSGLIGRKMRARFWSSIAAPMASMLIYEAVTMFYYVINARALMPFQIVAMLIRVLGATVLVQPLYLLFNAVLKPPRKSRYAR